MNKLFALLVLVAVIAVASSQYLASPYYGGVGYARPYAYSGLGYTGLGYSGLGYGYGSRVVYG